MKLFPMLKETREAVHKILKALHINDRITKLILYKTTTKLKLQNLVFVNLSGICM